MDFSLAGGLILRLLNSLSQQVQRVMVSRTESSPTQAALRVASHLPCCLFYLRTAASTPSLIANFADDTALVLQVDEQGNSPALDEFIHWWDERHLLEDERDVY